MNARTFSPEPFLPSGIMDYIGPDRAPARIKMKPEDFIVEERQRGGRLCTVGTTSDLDESETMASGRPGLVACTLVKRQETTDSALDLVAEDLDVDRSSVSYAGMKDRWAVTAQRIVVEGLRLEEVLRRCCPDKDNLFRHGWFIKDATPANGRLGLGHLETNRFTLNVAVPGLSASQIMEYVTPRLKQLASREWQIPNPYGRQRLARRQNQYPIGLTFIRDGAEAAVKRFLTETVPANESEAACRLRERLAEQWPRWQKMKKILEEPLDRGPKAYRALNMAMEYKIVAEMLRCGSFTTLMKSKAIRGSIQLWTGAYQGYWFNQALERVIRKEIVLEGDSIPLLLFDRRWDGKQQRDLNEDGPALSFYKRYLPKAIPDKVDPDVMELFLTPRRNWSGEPSIPWRPAFIPVIDLKHSTEDGIWHCQFELRSGSYATTLLGLLFQTDQEDDSSASERTSRPPRVRSNGGARHCQARR